LQVEPDEVVLAGHAAWANPAVPSRHVSHINFKYDNNLFIKIVPVG
jgi:hypothetical protein